MLSHFKPRSLAALLLAAVPALALAQTTQYEFRRPVGTLTVTGSPSTPTNPTDPTPSGSTPALSLSTQAIDFGNVATNTTAKAQVLVSNPGTGTLNITSAAAVTGAAAFAAGLTTCGSTLAAGADCLLEPTFSPTTTGTFNGVLRFTTALANSPHEVTLVGTAFNPVSLASATLPVGKLGEPYSHDFKTLLAVSNEVSPDKSLATWSGSGTLPAGLSFDTATGVLSGTPQAVSQGASYTVTGTYKNNQGQQVYTVVVNGGTYSFTRLFPNWEATCGVRTDGVLMCWGKANTSGRFTTALSGNLLVPTEVPTAPLNVTAFGAGEAQNSCALAGGQVYCTGIDLRGVLGNGTAGAQATYQAVPGITDAVDMAFSLAGNAVCVIRTAGAVSCWGYGGTYQLGNNSTVDSHVPINVSLPQPAVSIAMDYYSVCATLADTTVACWGTSYGNTPTLKAGFSGATKVLMGGLVGTTNRRACTTMTDGSVQCWTAADGTPKALAGVSFPQDVAVSYYGVFALNSAGMVQGWLGTRDVTLAPNATLAPATIGSTITGVSAGMFQACVTTSSSYAYCWGSNGSGQLGNGTVTSATITAPVKVGG